MFYVRIRHTQKKIINIIVWKTTMNEGRGDGKIK
jgi:hypothetical protein